MMLEYIIIVYFKVQQKIYYALFSAKNELKKCNLLIDVVAH